MARRLCGRVSALVEVGVEATRFRLEKREARIDGLGGGSADADADADDDASCLCSGPGGDLLGVGDGNMLSASTPASSTFATVSDPFGGGRGTPMATSVAMGGVGGWRRVGVAAADTAGLLCTTVLFLLLVLAVLAVFVVEARRTGCGAS